MKVKRSSKLHSVISLLFFISFISFFIMSLSSLPVFADQDGDSYDPPLDCNDANAAIHPGAAEACNGFDDDCDGSIDEGCTTDCSNPDTVGASKRVTTDSAVSEMASIAWTGSGYGIAWHDNRDSSQYEIYFALADAGGNKIGSDKRITSAASSQKEPSLVWTGTEFGIAFDDYRNSNYEIYFTRLDSSGNKIGTETRITSNSQVQRYPSLAWTGSEYGVVWQDYRDGNYEIYFSRINADGTKNGSDVRISHSLGISYYPAIVWDGDGYGVVWQDERDGNREVYFSQLDSSGIEIVNDTRITSNSSSSEYPDICWTGNEYGIVWYDLRDTNNEIYFTRVSNSGMEIGDDVRVTSNDQSSIYPSIAWTGSEYGIAWQDSRDGNPEIYYGRISSTGSRLGSDLRVTRDSSNSYNPDIARTGTDFGIAWHDNRDGNSEIYFQRVGCNCIDADSDLYTSCNDCNDSNASINPGAVDICNSIDDDCDGTVDGDTDKDGYLPCSGDCDNGNPAVHPGDTEICNGIDDNCDSQNDYVPDGDADTYLYCSGDCNDADASIHSGATEICNGVDDDCDSTIDEGCQTLCANKEKAGSDRRTTENFAASRRPSLVLSSTGYGIAWQDNRDGNLEIYFAFYNFEPRKTTADVRITSNTSNSQNASLVWTGKEFGAAWQDDQSGNDEIYFARFDKDGVKIGSDVRVTTDPSASQNPSIVWNGNGYAVAWNDGRDKNDEIYFARLDKQGNKVGADVRVTRTSTATIDPSLVWNGNGYGVVWKDLIFSNNLIYFVRLGLDGSKIGSEAKVNGVDSNSDNPALVWADGRYGIAWKDRRDSGKDQIYFAQYDSAGIKIGSDSRITDNLDLSLAAEPSLAWSGGEYSVSWTDHRDGNYEIYFSRINRDGNPVESNFRFTNNVSNSGVSSIVWDGSRYAIAWEDDQDANYEIYFGRLGCNCVDGDADTYTSCNDCNDSNASIHPGAAESCNFVDDDCDGTVDEGFDADSDGWTTCAGDCNDSDYSINPGAPDVCNDSIDNNCDGTVDNKDSDHDGYVDDDCINGTDCDDSDATVYPGAPELCDNKDNDCDSSIDEGFATPGATTGLAFQTKSKVTFSWTAVIPSTSYDTVKGNLAALKSTNGDFSTTIITCLENNDTGTLATDTENPGATGQGFYYLVRALNCNVDGTYNNPSDPKQSGDRDSEIASSPNRCP